MSTIFCPICRNPLKALNRHLKVCHGVANHRERSILLLLAKGRVNIRSVSCHLSGCGFTKTRFDRHLRVCHTELSPQEMEEAKNTARRKQAVKMLGELRRTNPVPSMRTTFDEEDDDAFEFILEHPQALSPQVECDLADCRQWRLEARSLRLERDNLVTEVGSLRRKLQLLHKRPMLAVASCVAAEDVDLALEEMQMPKRREEAAAVAMEKPSKSRKTPPTSGSSTNFSPWTSGSGRGNTMRQIALPPAMEEFLQGYGEHHEGLDPTSPSMVPVRDQRGLTQVQMKSVHREVTLALTSLKRPVVVHQLSVKRKKMARLPSKADIASCKLAAARRIPELLELMASKPTDATRCLFYG
ncbi:hypothetical protein CesoFtcFv8_009586 [Champsocephalus esox]|uniref:Uncharacterized protein n=2 Tax=Champsocephalus esox TaxID=159716 RepID=A0AAN8H317_9TELE|nr:hypothetical protein CesoFtcFv8_009586 [Champsocephalus esox]